MTDHTMYSESQPSPVGEEIKQIFWVLIRKWYVVALTIIAAVSLVVLYIWTTTPLFSSRVEILIDPRQKQTVESEVIQTGLGASAAGADTLLLESQVEVLQSQKVIDALIKQERLTEDPEFSGSSSSGFSHTVKNMVKTVVYGPQSMLWNDMSSYDRALNTLRKRTTVERQRNTYVISVTMLSSVPKKAARLANALADIYIDDVNGAASAATLEASKILSSKLEQLGKVANQAAEAVETYRRRNNLIDTNDTLVIEQHLSNLNREFSQARTQLQSAAARRNQLRSAFENEGGSAIDYSEIGESTLMSQLQGRLAAVESREADLKSAYLPSHPLLRRVRDRKDAIKASMRQEHKRILNRLDVAYNTALENSTSLKKEVDQLISQMASSNTDAVRLRELQREAETSRTLYESFLRRSKEAQEQIDIPNSTARIISSAFPSSRPVHPAVVLLLVSSFALGSVLGLIAVFLNHTLFGHQRPRQAAPKQAAPAQSEPRANTASRAITASRATTASRASPASRASTAPRPANRAVSVSLLDQMR